jgi:hypothetical protein
VLIYTGEAMDVVYLFKEFVEVRVLFLISIRLFRRSFQYSRCASAEKGIAVSSKALNLAYNWNVMRK